MKIESYNRKKQTAEIIYEDKMRVISEEAAALMRIDIHKDIPDELIPELLVESEKILCRKYLYEQISKYSKTKRGYYKKLVEKGYSKEISRESVDHAEENGYIDDFRYAERYVEINHGHKGHYKLKTELLNKGISSAIAEEVLRELPSQENEALTMARKLSKTPPQSREEKAKLARRLASRGFGYDEVNYAINHLSDEE